MDTRDTISMVAGRTGFTASAPRCDEAATVSPPIACTLDPGLLTTRMAAWQQLLARAGNAPRAAVDGGVTVRFPADPELAAQIAALAAAEQSCCSFFTFEVRVDHAGTDLTVTAPPEAAPLVAALFGIPA
jgi:hypothetical protein